MEFSFYGHAFFIISVCFFFMTVGTIIGIYLLDLYVFNFSWIWDYGNGGKDKIW